MIKRTDEELEKIYEQEDDKDHLIGHISAEIDYLKEYKKRLEAIDKDEIPKGLIYAAFCDWFNDHSRQAFDIDLYDFLFPEDFPEEEEEAD